MTNDESVSDLRQSRRLEMMNGSKPCGPSGGFQAPSPKRRRPRLRVSCSPSPQPSPSGEGETFDSAWTIRPSSVVVCLADERQKSGDFNRSIPIFVGPEPPSTYEFSAHRSLVAQICNLLYRRFVIGRASESSKALALADLPQNAILR